RREPDEEDEARAGRGGRPRQGHLAADQGDEGRREEPRLREGGRAARPAAGAQGDADLRVGLELGAPASRRLVRRRPACGAAGRRPASRRGRRRAQFYFTTATTAQPPKVSDTAKESSLSPLRNGRATLSKRPTLPRKR